MEPVEAPLRWWAEGGYAEVGKQLNKRQQSGETVATPEHCRKLIRRLLRARYRATGDPVWQPYGHRGYEELRRRLRENLVLSHDLV